MRGLKLTVVLERALAASACTSIVEIRTEHSAVSVRARGDKGLEECVTGRPAPPEVVNSLEDYGNFFIGDVEFDDQGWLYPSREKGQPDQIHALVQRMRGELKNHPDGDLVTLVFVHGWHHNAHGNDSNVNEFRGMVERTRRVFARQRPGGKEWRVVGVYVGWLGKAVDVPVRRYSTILDRRYAAEHVAKGSVRDPFAELRQLELEQPGTDDPRVCTIVVGHSFGGLIVFNAPSQAIVNELVTTKPRHPPASAGDSKCEASKATGPRPWPDQMVLINQPSKRPASRRCTIPRRWRKAAAIQRSGRGS